MGHCHSTSKNEISKSLKWIKWSIWFHLVTKSTKKLNHTVQNESFKSNLLKVNVNGNFMLNETHFLVRSKAVA